MFFIFGKSYDRIAREVNWHIWEKKYVHKQYKDMIKDMYDGTLASGRIIEGGINIFFCYNMFIHGFF